MDNDTKDFLVAGVGVFVILVGLIAMMAGFVTAVSYFQCQQVGRQTQRMVTYRVLTGCYVQNAGTWVPYDVWVHNTGN